MTSPAEETAQAQTLASYERQPHDGCAQVGLNGEQYAEVDPLAVWTLQYCVG